jgi:hypothetical protein
MALLIKPLPVADLPVFDTLEDFGVVAMALSVFWSSGSGEHYEILPSPESRPKEA